MARIVRATDGKFLVQKGFFFPSYLVMKRCSIEGLWIRPSDTYLFDQYCKKDTAEECEKAYYNNRKFEIVKEL